MLLKILFSLLAALWLYRVIGRFLVPPPPPSPPPPPPPPPSPRTDLRPRDNDGDYIDYEEIK